VTGSEDGKAQLYVCEVCVPFDDLVALARARLTRQLTVAEREKYLH
jgi:hypothetical protein